MDHHSISKIESLERRCLMSASVTAHLRYGFLIVDGTKGPDDIDVSLVGSDIVVMDGSTQVISEPESSVHIFIIKGKGGGDTITLDSSLDNSLLGASSVPGCKVFEAGNTANTIDDDSDVVWFIGMGNGANTITAMDPNDFMEITVGRGADTITGGDGRFGIVTGNGGDQTVTLGNGGSHVYYRGDGTLTVGSGTVVCGNAPDTVDASAGENDIWAGPHTVVSGSTDDYVCVGKDPTSNISGVPSANITRKDARRHALGYILNYIHFPKWPVVEPP